MKVASRAKSPIAAVLLVLLGIVAALGLGVWQLQRAAEKDAIVRASEGGAGWPANESILDRTRVIAPDLAGRRARVEGDFLPSATIFLDNRTYRGAAGFHVLTAFRLRGEPQAYLVVLRGWVAGDPRQRTRLPPIRTPQGPVSLDVILETDLAAPIRFVDEGAARPQDLLWQAFSREKFATWARIGPVLGVARQIDGPEDGLVRDWPQAGRMADRHRGYAIQWFALAAALLVAASWLAWRAWRGSRVDPGTG